jgi:hypothetical protein
MRVGVLTTAEVCRHERSGEEIWEKLKAGSGRRI